jgi:hypothetical protein
MLPGQLDLLEWARKDRDAGMSRASDAQDRKVPGWADLAYAAIETVARTQATVHIDDVLRLGIPQPKHPNAMGAVWLRAIRNEIIQRSNQTRPCSVDRRKHAHQYPVYFSRICDPRCAP